MIPELISRCGPDGLPCQVATIAGLIAAFFVLYLAVLFLVAVIGGWRALAEKYGLREGRAMPDGEQLRWRGAALSGRLPTSYNNCLVFTLGAEGLGIAALPLFSFGHEPLFIPWREIELQDKKALFGTPLRIKITGTPFSFTVWGKTAAAIRAAIRK